MIVPDDRKSRAALERWADDILREAHSRLSKDGAVKDHTGVRVWSLDVRNAEEAGSDLILGGTVLAHDAVDDLIASLEVGTTLTRTELLVVQALAEGAPSPGQFEWTSSIADMLGKTPVNIRNTWMHAKRKLISEWANEPEERKVTKLYHSIEGSGFNLISGAEKDWRMPVVDPVNAKEALAEYEANAYRDNDWNYERSLTDDGWQLGDDSLWADWRLAEKS